MENSLTVLHKILPKFSLALATLASQVAQQMQELSLKPDNLSSVPPGPMQWEGRSPQVVCLLASTFTLQHALAHMNTHTHVIF